MTRASRQVVKNMIMETARPYAALRLSAVWKPITRPTVKTINYTHENVSNGWKALQNRRWKDRIAQRQARAQY